MEEVRLLLLVVVVRGSANVWIASAAPEMKVRSSAEEYTADSASMSAVKRVAIVWGGRQEVCMEQR